MEGSGFLGGCGLLAGRVWEKQGRKNHPLPTSVPQAAGARPAAPACAPAGVARPSLNCATARHGSGLPGNRAPCPPGVRRFSPSPPSPAAGNPPAQPAAEVCPSGRKVHSGAGLPQAGRGVPRGSCIPPAAPGAQRPRSQKVTVVVPPQPPQRPAPCLSPRGPPVASPSRGSAPPGAPIRRQAAPLPLPPSFGRASEAGSGVPGGTSTHLCPRH